MPTKPPNLKAGGQRKAWRQSAAPRQQRGYDRRHELIRAELQRSVILCEECSRNGRVAVGQIADHIIPLAKGGSGDRSNYQWLCRECAVKKDARDRGVRRRRRPNITNDGWPTEED